MRAKYLIAFALVAILQAFVIFLLFYLKMPSLWANVVSLSAFLLPLVAYFLILYCAPVFKLWSRLKRLIVFASLSLVVAIAGFCFFNFFCFTMSFGGWPWEHYMPGEGQVRQQFESHKIEYVRLVALLQKDPSLANGDLHSPIVPEYKALIHKTGIKFVTLREDGAIELALAGYGSTISSDAYMGMRYLPNDHKMETRPDWMTPTVVASLDSMKLPQNNGEVATGLYVIPVEPEWSIYRLEIQE